jgi:hypothetical protein
MTLTLTTNAIASAPQRTAIPVITAFTANDEPTVTA